MSDEQNDDERERRREEDNSEFGLENAIGTGDATAEVTATSSNKMVLIGIIAGAISFLLVACITVGFMIGFGLTPGKGDANKDDIAKKQVFTPAEEAKAKIKQIDRDAKSIRFLMFNNSRKSFDVTEHTEFLDREGNTLAKGLEDPAVREDEYCVILPTDDQTSLRWLKLTPPPK